MASWVDPRSAALFRMGIGAALTAELLGAWPDRCTMYSADGVLPLPDHELPWPVVHRGSCSVTTILFAVHLLFAALLLCGCFSRSSAAVAYALQLSLLHRNP